MNQNKTFTKNKKRTELDELSTTINSQNNTQNSSLNVLISSKKSRSANISLFSNINCCLASRDKYSRLDDGNNEYVIRVKVASKWCCGLGTIGLILFLLILFFAYIPSAAQSSMNNASLIQIYLSMIKPTNDSIVLNSTLQIVNAGQYDATIDSTKSMLVYDGTEIGTFLLPKLNINANLGATFSLMETINMDTKTGRDAFQKMATKLLSGNDVIITFKSTPKLILKLGPLSISVGKVTMNKDLLIKGTVMQSSSIKNFTILVMNTTEIGGIAEIEFGVSSQLHVEGGDVEMEIYDIWNNQLGVSYIPSMVLHPGYNKLSNISTILTICESCSNISSNNTIAIQEFAGNFIGGIGQILNMRGPTKGLVISNVINADAFLYGYCS
eukprot:499879_1